MHGFLATILVVAFAYSYVWQALNFDAVSIHNEPYYFTVEPGTSLGRLTQQLSVAGVFKHPDLVRWYGKVKGYANNLKAGEYKIMPRATAAEVLRMVVQGDVVKYSFTIVEGWRSRDLLNLLAENPKIKHELNGLSDQQIIAKLELPITHLEGMFFPDTYYFTAGTTDVDFLKRAYLSMQEKLQAAWQNRSPNNHLKTPYEALILASIIEKESGVFDEYHEISGVYQRRLVKRMRLQADPTVAYFWGDKLKGPLLYKHLRFDSPYNTYTRYGLPPTPIALPSIKALNAALHPAPGETLFFVATGEGGHIFSKTLPEHNAAVKKFRENNKNS